jgi:enoyl-CoA hydratase/carnithine racemase
METTHNKCEIADHITRVTIDNPLVNPVSPQFRQETELVFGRISNMDDVRVVVLTGQGKVFCAGADIMARLGHVAELGDHCQNSRTSRKNFHFFIECKRRVICAVSGPALGLTWRWLRLATFASHRRTAHSDFQNSVWACLATSSIQCGFLGIRSRA